MAPLVLTIVLICFLRLSNCNEFEKKQELEEFVLQLNDHLKEMKDKISQLEQSITEQNFENEVLKKRLLVLQSENEDFRGNIRELSWKIQRLEDKDTETVRHAVDLVKEAWHTHDSQNNVVQEEGEDYYSTATKYETKHGEVSNRRRAESINILNKISKSNIFRRQLIEENENIAFSVFVKDDITGLSKGDVIKFDGVMVNDGSGYDVKTGMFTAPRSGLYLFAFVVEDYHEQDLWVILYEDNRIRSQAVAEPFDTNQNIMGGNVVLLHVREGSRIWVAISKGNRVQENWSTFTGILLR